MIAGSLKSLAVAAPIAAIGAAPICPVIGFWPVRLCLWVSARKSEILT